jgi:hypothetical protein
VIVLDDKVLISAGLSYAEALALMAPVEGETVVHVVRCLDPISSRVTTPSVDGGGSVRLTSPGEQGRSADLPTITPTTPVKLRRAARFNGKGR